MNERFKRGGLQRLSREITNKYNVTLSALILIDAIQEGSTFNKIAKLYGVESDNAREFQFISDLVKNTNKRSTLPVFQVTQLGRSDLIAMGLNVTVGRHPRWLSLTQFGARILKDINKELYANV